MRSICRMPEPSASALITATCLFDAQDVCHIRSPYGNYCTPIIMACQRVFLWYSIPDMKAALIACLLLAGVIIEPVQKQHGKPDASKDQKASQQQPKPTAEGRPPAQQETVNNYYLTQQKAWDWHDAGAPPTWSNWGLVIVGIGAIISAILTLCTILRQTKHIARQAVSMRRQTTILRNSVRAARKGAKAALLNAQAVINSERAWLLATPELPDKLRPGDASRVTRFKWSIKNVGRTPARILETDAVAWRVADMQGIPKQPRYEGDRPVSLSGLLLVPGDSVPIYWLIEPVGDPLTVEQVAQIKESKLTLFAYGFVKYLDIFDNPVHTTRFCHTYFYPRPGDAREEGFYAYLFAPASYTECD